jgi:hypothetical protein
MQSSPTSSGIPPPRLRGQPIRLHDPFRRRVQHRPRMTPQHMIAQIVARIQL